MIARLGREYRRNNNGDFISLFLYYRSFGTCGSDDPTRAEATIHPQKRNFFVLSVGLGQSVSQIDPRPLVQLAATSTFSAILAALATGYRIHHTKTAYKRVFHLAPNVYGIRINSKQIFWYLFFFSHVQLFTEPAVWITSYYCKRVRATPKNIMQLWLAWWTGLAVRGPKQYTEKEYLKLSKPNMVLTSITNMVVMGHVRFFFFFFISFRILDPFF